MNSYQIIEFGKPLELRSYGIPKPTGTEILVRIAGCGVCHSDVHLWGGYYSLGGGKRITLVDRGAKLPFTMGHEIVGEAEALGPDATGITVGTRGVIFPWIGCGACFACTHGRELQCTTPRTIGTRRDGGYSDYVIVPHPRYIVEYGSLDPMVAATLACSGLTAYSAVKKLPEMTGDDAVVVIGAGGLGLAAVGYVAALSPARLIVGDIDRSRREAARRAGAVGTFDPSVPDAQEALKALHPQAPLGIIDFVGTEKTAQFAVDVLARCGTAVFVGLFGGEIPVSVSKIAMQNISIRGSNVGTLGEFRQLMELVRAGRVPTIPVATRKMADVNAILGDLSEGKIVGRVVMRP
jgi:D-arabinose 1-dehydrogenase-like Zn-dependent alcohol dehydrogenase